MYKCLACRKCYVYSGCKLVEAFQHLQHKFLVCRYCFLIFATVNKITSFNRIPILAHSMYFNIHSVHQKYQESIKIYSILLTKLNPNSAPFTVARLSTCFKINHLTKLKSKRYPLNTQYQTLMAMAVTRAVTDFMTIITGSRIDYW